MITRLSKTAAAVARNQGHRFFGGATRGGHRTVAWDAAARAAHAAEIFARLAPLVGAVSGRVGLEIGPGDTLGVCRLFRAAGAARVYAVERFAHPTDVPDGVELLRDEVEHIALPPGSVHFAYSNDVFEHVRDVPGAFRSVAAALAPGGVFVNSVDLRGHNSYNDARRPLEHLCCPDWLYSLMHSHIVTSNRVRPCEFVAAARAAGFVVEVCRAEASADPAYLATVRRRALRRWRGLPDFDLATTQLMLACRKPA
ncbi:methyltransferase domain-containing protein [bacterium]|nr:methyltransferase domain-containing protein [bacterium]